ncbi:MAG: NUDIX domain-containing protein [Nanoarchaeota archaeon]
MERKSKENKFGVHIKAIVFDQKGRVLTLKKKDTDRDVWDFPGGQIQFGSNVYNTVWEIVKEQTYLDIDIFGPSNVWTLKMTEHLQIICISFRCQWDWEKYFEDKEDIEDDDEAVFLSTEFKEYRWMSPEEILEGNYPVWMKNEIKIVDE